MILRHIGPATLVAATFVVGGFAAGAALTASSSAVKSEPVAAGRYEEEIAPYVRLANGRTAGNYRLETPLDERPDFVPVLTSDGNEGYLKVEHFDPRVVDVSSEGVHEISGAELEELKAAEAQLQPNRRGEIWAPVYGEDGETQIGEILLSENPEH